jgi:hypothetical protein
MAQRVGEPTAAEDTRTAKRFHADSPLDLFIRFGLPWGDPAGGGRRCPVPEGTSRRRDAGTGRWWWRSPLWHGRLAAIRQVMAHRSPPNATARRRDAGTGRCAAIRQVMARGTTPQRRDAGTWRCRSNTIATNHDAAARPRSGRYWPSWTQRPGVATRARGCVTLGRDPAGDGPSPHAPHGTPRRRDVGTGDVGLDSGSGIVRAV